MATQKITITLPKDQVREIHALVNAAKSPNVSAFVAHAVKIALADVRGWREMLQQALEETGGPPTDRERAWADSILAPGGRKPRSRKRKAA